MGEVLRLDKPNQLISVIPKSEINLVQQKCFNVFLRKAQRGLMFDDKYKNREIDKSTRYLFEISCKDLKDKAGLNKNDYEYVKEELKELTNITVEVIDKTKEDHWSIFSLLERVEREGNTFEFSLDWMIMKALKEHNYFTKIDLLQVAKLNSRYSVILYEMAKRYYDKSNKHITIPKMTISEIRKITKTEDKYSLIADFKRYVLDRACKEISEKTDIRLSYETEKEGRRIAYIDFQIEKKEEEIPDEIEVNTQDQEKEYSTEVLDLFKLLPKEERVETNKEELAHLLDKHSFKYLKSDIEYTKDSNPESFMAFLKASCSSGHYAAAEIEKEEKKEKLAQKRAEEEKRREKVKEKIQQKAHEKAVEKYAELSDEELDSYADNYDSLPNILKKRVSRKDYIIGALEDEFEEELNELAAGIF